MTLKCTACANYKRYGKRMFTGAVTAATVKGECSIDKHLSDARWLFDQDCGKFAKDDGNLFTEE